MNDTDQRRLREAASAEEAGVDVRRYASVIRRSRGLIGVVVFVVTAIVVVLSLILPKTYESTATIALNENAGLLTSSDAESTQRRLATIKSLIGSPSVDAQAAEDLPGLTPDDIHAAVSAAVDPEANLVEVTASDRKPVQAMRIANTVARAFIKVEEELENRRVVAALANLREQLNSVASDPSASTEVATIRQRMSDLTVQQASAGADLQIVKAAEIPTGPASPRPLRNGILALFASLFLGVLIALARDQLRPRISEPRELSRLTGWQVLAGIPHVRRRFGRRNPVALAVEHEAYQTLSAAFQQTVPPGGDQRMVLITSAVHAEGKTTVTARLGQALAQAGHKTLLISADLRWPSLHEAFGLPLEPGLSEVLGLAERAGVSQYVLPATAHSVSLPGVRGRNPGELHVLTSGSPMLDPSNLFASKGARELFRYIQDFDYAYILVDGPPIVGIADVQPLAQLTDGVLFVARLDRLTMENIIDVQELFGRLGTTPFGSVVVGARVNASPYYLERPPLMKTSAGDVI